MGTDTDHSATPARDYEAMPIIGWREWMALPELGIPRVKAKIDSGARSSALHAFDIEHFTGDDGRDLVRFRTQPKRKATGEGIECVAEIADVRDVKSSNGELEERIMIRTLASLMGETWPIELTLTTRDAMRFRMLLGREAVRGKFLVDTGTSYLDDTLVRRRKK